MRGEGGRSREEGCGGMRERAVRGMNEWCDYKCDTLSLYRSERLK